MEYRHLGSSGLRVSALSYGSWVTFGDQMNEDAAYHCMHWAFDTELDGSGRITIRQELLDHAGITKGVVIGGSIGLAEIWEPEAWARKHAELGESIGALVEGLGDPA